MRSSGSAGSESNGCGLRLRLAGFRLEAAEVERVWAVLSAHRQGLSIRQIAAAIGLSRARVHQLLSAPAAADAPARLNALHEQGWPVAAPDAPAALEPTGRASRLAGRRWPRSAAVGCLLAAAPCHSWRLGHAGRLANWTA